MIFKVINGDFMKATLTGTLSQMPLLEILNLLNSGKKTGKLLVRNKNTKGEIYFREGEVVHSACCSYMSEHAILNILAWTDGTFSFEANVLAAEISITIPTKTLLLQTAQNVQDWGDIKKIIPYIFIKFSLKHTFLIQ